MTTEQEWFDDAKDAIPDREQDLRDENRALQLKLKAAHDELAAAFRELAASAATSPTRGDTFARLGSSLVFWLGFAHTVAVAGLAAAAIGG